MRCSQAKQEVLLKGTTSSDPSLTKESANVLEASEYKSPSLEENAESEKKPRLTQLQPAIRSPAQQMWISNSQVVRNSFVIEISWKLRFY